MGNAVRHMHDSLVLLATERDCLAAENVRLREALTETLGYLVLWPSDGPSALIARIDELLKTASTSQETT